MIRLNIFLFRRSLFIAGAILIICSGAFTQVKGPAFTGVSFLDSSNGWIISSGRDSAFVLRSTDSGRTWKWSSIPNTTFKVRFVNPRTGWAVGANGSILRSIDGGATWRVQQSGTDETLYDVFAVDQNHAWAVGRNGIVLKTENGGETWTSRKLEFDVALTSVYFVNEKKGWATGYGVILSSEDGGATWSSRYNGDWKQLGGSVFANDKTGWVTTGSPTILHTRNAGKSWGELQLPGIGWAQVSFVDPLRGWAAVSRGGTSAYTPGSNEPGPSSSILRTVNGGRTWVKQLSIMTTKKHGGWISGISFADNLNGWAVGGGGLILNTTDGGRHWRSRYLSYPPAVIASGQCHGSKVDLTPFDKVSPAYHDMLISRFGQFLDYKCEKRFEKLYEMLTPSFRQLNKKDDFVRDYRLYYSGKNGLISFVSNKVGQTISPIDGEPDLWFIEGCIGERINGRRRFIQVTLEAIRDVEAGKKQIFFTDVTTRPNLLGVNEKCHT